MVPRRALGGLAGKSNPHEQCWRLAEKKEGRGTEGIGGDAGLQQNDVEVYYNKSFQRR